MNLTKAIEGQEYIIRQIETDDEELDAFKGRASESYTAEEVEMFRDILLTLRPDDVAGWSRSIQLRGITLPEEIREELIMIVGEQRDEKQL